MYTTTKEVDSCCIQNVILHFICKGGKFYTTDQHVPFKMALFTNGKFRDFFKYPNLYFLHLIYRTVSLNTESFLFNFTVFSFQFVGRTGVNISAAGQLSACYFKIKRDSKIFFLFWFEKQLWRRLNRFLIRPWTTIPPPADL